MEGPYFAKSILSNGKHPTVKEHLEKWRKCDIPLPKLILDPVATVFNFMPDMAKLDNYQFEEKVKFDIAV